MALSVVATACSSQMVNGYSNSGSDSRPLPRHVFAEDSFWYRELPADAPVAQNSRDVISRIRNAAPAPGYADLSRGRPQIAINTTTYTPPIYVARNTDPVATFDWDNCQFKRDDQGLIGTNLTGLHIPADARPSTGSDGEMVVYNADTGTYTDTWVTGWNNGRWSACWGGTIRDAKTNPGVFPHPWGATASGLPLEPGTLKARELATGRIDHVVGVVLPRSAVDTSPSGPALRTDGSGVGSDTIAMGQMLRLPASLDISNLNLAPPVRAVALAAQRYGLIVWDTGGGITLRAENAQAFKADPYPTIFEGAHPALAMWGEPDKGYAPFPFEHLQVLERGYLPGGVPAPLE